MRGRPNSARQIETRLKAAAVEIDHWTEYDYVLVNRDVDECLAALKAILAAERLKASPAGGLGWNSFPRLLQPLDWVPSLLLKTARQTHKIGNGKAFRAQGRIDIRIPQKSSGIAP